MFWDGNDLADDGYNWMNRGRTDTIPTHQKSISIEATRFFDGYVPGEKVVSMTKTFYRFAGQQTSLYFVHYVSHPAGIHIIYILYNLCCRRAKETGRTRHSHSKAKCKGDR